MPKQKYEIQHVLDRIEEDKNGRKIPIYRRKKTPIKTEKKQDAPQPLQA